MILKNAMVDGILTDIVIENGKIARLCKTEKEGMDIAGMEVIPGLIDIHTHGCAGDDTMDGRFDKMCRFLAKNGTTSWLPTTMTESIEKIAAATQADTDCPGAQILGFHMEGPYLSREYKGAHNENCIIDPNLEDYKKLNRVKVVTIAPELPGAMEFIKNCDAKVQIGHTACNYDLAVEAMEAGAGGLTHTFNAMPPLHHRAPGPIGAAVTQNAYAELICDGLHVQKAAVLALYRIFGPERLILISDAMRATGLSDGEYEFGGMRVIVKEAVARTEAGAIAGSTSTLWHCVKTAAGFGIPWKDAVRMATQTPAEYLGISKGQIGEGYDADLLVLDSARNIQKVFIAGEEYKG